MSAVDERRSGAGRGIWLHLGLLTIVLSVVAAWLGTGSSFITDEAFVRTQLDVLEDDGSWLLPHPFPEADPDGTAFPLHGAVRFDDGYVLYGKHPALVYLYAVAHRLGGDLALVGVSILGTVGAAAVAGALAARWQRGAGPVAVWVVGAARLSTSRRAPSVCTMMDVLRSRRRTAVGFSSVAKRNRSSPPRYWRMTARALGR